MVAKCSNPSCSASFRSLKEGRLFRLENDPTFRSCNVSTPEYFWLCHSCASTMTLRLKEGGTVVTVLLPEAIRGVPDGVALTSTDRRKGLLLRTVSLTLPAHLGGPENGFEGRIPCRMNGRDSMMKSRQERFAQCPTGGFHGILSPRPSTGSTDSL